MIPQAEEAVTQVAVLVAPANGVAVLRDVFRSLEGNFPGVVVILLQEGEGGERSVADNLNVAPNFFILPGLDGTPLRNGRGYVVRAGATLEIDADARLRRALGPTPAASAWFATPPMNCSPRPNSVPGCSRWSRTSKPRLRTIPT